MRPSVRPFTAWTTNVMTWTRATCTSPEHERRARTLSPLFILSHTSLVQVLSFITPISIVIHERISSSCFSPCSSTCPASLLLFLLLLALRVVHWARQLDRHGNLVPLREQWEWRRLRRFDLPHRPWAENMPITAVQKVCPSVSRRRLLCSIEQGNLREK